MTHDIWCFSLISVAACHRINSVASVNWAPWSGPQYRPVKTISGQKQGRIHEAFVVLFAPELIRGQTEAEKKIFWLS
jgi:hypothetical protein